MAMVMVTVATMMVKPQVGTIEKPRRMTKGTLAFKPATRKVEITEYWLRCPDCGKEISHESVERLLYLFRTHAFNVHDKDVKAEVKS